MEGMKRKKNWSGKAGLHREIQRNWAKVVGSSRALAKEEKEAEATGFLGMGMALLSGLKHSPGKCFDRPRNKRLIGEEGEGGGGAFLKRDKEGEENCPILINSCSAFAISFGGGGFFWLLL
jgi:hypothetical protein